jgi:hypothetical protein
MPPYVVGHQGFAVGFENEFAVVGEDFATGVELAEVIIRRVQDVAGLDVMDIGAKTVASGSKDKIVRGCRRTVGLHVLLSGNYLEGCGSGLLNGLSRSDGYSAAFGTRAAGGDYGLFILGFDWVLGGD